jgi:uncharacterized protein (TIRG00374 family)
MSYNEIHMSQKTFFGRHWKLIINIATILALVVFFIAIQDQLTQTFDNFEKIRWWVFALVVLTQIWNYDAQTRLYRALFRIVGNNFKYTELLRAAMELNFINNVFPSGGISGISYFGARMRSEEVTAGKATLVQMMKLLMLYISFEVLLMVGLFLVAIEGQVNSLVLMLSAVIATSIVFGTALFAYILGSKNRVEHFHRWLANTYNYAARTLTRKPDRQYRELMRVRFLMEELHSNYHIIRQNYKKLKMPLVHALFANLSEILCIYVVYIAFGQWVNLGAIIIAYSVANFAGLVSVLPGGVGVYEALMTTVLVAAGIPLALSLPVTIMYRVLSSLIQLPPGYYLYHKALQQEKLAANNV